MRRAFAVALGVVLVAACGFPDVQFDGAGTTDASSGSGGGDARGGGDGSSSGSEAGGDSNMPSDGSSDADSAMNLDGSSESDSLVVDTGPDVILDVSPDSPLCDQDHDTFIGKQCGGNDCCDTDWTAKPGQTGFFTKPDLCGSFDYNCDGNEHPEFGMFSCAGGVTGCTETTGFVGGVPGCGVTGPWASSCTNQITSCQPGPTSMPAQGCN